ncbi:patatin-like phospholipase family protein [Magnetospirillum sp. UT-4]|uniref:patatin-like phospholipase family protein n=1 Tax=Magnetospirillum sp. UT-4 TaxID=2681467 RepID=UPI001385ACE1|nr:patatin-like phospholipase family protein [Magnetospirillum sp. UT-4]CAA7612674.1 conserved exported hypothetical protein [Magnetospirillum sp. UT-4]
MAFEIGLVMAGAVSGGAYTAGVMDFMIEALDTWYGAMKDEAHLPPEQQTVPRHEVLLKAMAGASAGSVTASILAIALAYRFPPVRLAAGQNAPTMSGNPLFEGWVNSVDIQDLLSTTDFDGNADGEPAHRLKSALNSRKIDKTVKGILGSKGLTMQRDWVASKLPVQLMVGNLRGVPYGLTFRGASGNGHEMMRHGDHMSFCVHGAGSGTSTFIPGPGYLPLVHPNDSDTANWRQLGNAAMASSAFPFALRPRRLTRSPLDYDHRTYLQAGDCTLPPGDPLHCSTYQMIFPAWSRPQAGEYAFLCMDGGIMNNEPIDLVRSVLTDGEFERNPREGVQAHRAVLLVDPFLDPASYGPDEERPLHELLFPLLGAWKSQCRFKPEDLSLAQDTSVYSRFVIAPSRDYGPTDAEHPLASGGLHAFLGFFGVDFRRHDYQLGRRNAQQFLRMHFTLPENNPLFTTWAPQVRATWLAKTEYLSPPPGTTALHLPIIPLLGDCDTMLEKGLPWPVGGCDPARLRASIKTRIAAAYDAFKDDIGADWKIRLWLLPAWLLKKNKIVDWAVGALTEALEKQKLLR